MFKRRVQLLLCGTLVLGLGACQPSQTQPTAPTQASPTQFAQNSATPSLVATNEPEIPTETTQVLATPTIEPTIAPSPTPFEASIEPLPEPILISEPLPEFMQTMLDSPLSFSLNDQTTYANPALLPERSAETINLQTLPSLNLLQKIGLGEVVDLAIAPNNQFMTVATSINLVVYDLPSLQQRYVAQVPAAIYNLSISADSATINLLVNPDLINPSPVKATLRRYASQTGAFIDQTEQMVDLAQWDPSEPIVGSQSIPTHSGGYGAYSPNQAFFAHLEPPPGLVLGLGVAIERVVDQTTIYTDEQSLYLRFSPDSAYAAVFFEQSIQLIDLNSGAVQHLLIPAYSYGNFSPDSTLYATSDGFQLLDLNQARIFKSFPNRPIDTMYRTYTRPTFSPDGQIISNGENIWAINQEPPLIRQQILPFAGDVASGMAIVHGASEWLLTSEKRFTRNNELLELELFKADQLYSSFTVTDTLNDAYFSPDGTQIGFIFNDNELHFYDLASKSFIQSKIFPYALKELAFSNNGSQIVVSFEENPQSIVAVLLNFNDLSIIRTFGAVEQQFALDYNNLSYQAYQRNVPIQIIAAADLMIIPIDSKENQAIVYQVSDGMPIYQIKQGMLSPDNRLYISIEGGQLQLWGLKP
ncbi:hypothetical protein [Herpetosiphon gulosus]|uniref:WD40 repeat domain-containing protein n=1 Tax=Herpetosiphon gulosus TaxID=1973496 RepID=A0ABP9WZN4_9CHLR